jgi:AcrR family transcriptional regulator
VELKNERDNIQTISILDITMRAGVNRATFYAHFRDKNDLLGVSVREIFQNRLRYKLPKEPGLNGDTIYVLIVATLSVLGGHEQHCKRINKQYEPLFNNTIQQELQDTLKLIMNNIKPASTYAPAFLSWAIFGAANEWMSTKLHSQEIVARDIFSLVANSLKEDWVVNN